MKAIQTARFGIIAALIALVGIAAPATAGAKDINRDRIPDRWEKRQKLSLKKDQRKLDQDRDGLKNRGEWLAGTKARDKDSDDDGTPDGDENAGVISGYDAETQTLSITLYAGGEITGTVNERTEIECDSDDPSPVSGRDHDDDHGDDEAEDDSRDDSDDNSRDDSNDNDSNDDDNHGRGHEDGCDDECSPADLAAGVEVEEAEVKYTADGPVFTELELEKVKAES